MRFEARPGRRRRIGSRRRRSALAILLAGALLGLVASPAEPAGAQTPTPARPLILIGGTFTPVDFQGYGDAPSWDDIVDWLETEGGYTKDADLFVAELRRLPQESNPAAGAPPNWGSRHWAVPQWPAFVDMLHQYNVSTAGLAPMQESVNWVKALVTLLSALHGGSQVDVVGHSQGGFVARAAVRQMQQDGDPANDDLVHTLVALGAPSYGIPQEVEPAAVGLNNFGLFGELGADPLVEEIFADCREDAWLPICADIFRRHSDWPFDWRIPNPEDPDDSTYPGTPPYEDWDLLFVTSTLPDLNALTGVGPTPGPTDYYNLHSVNYPGLTAAEDARLAEPVLYSPSGSNVWNWTPQNLCGASYEVSHTSEFGNPGMRSLMGYALGFKPATEPPDC
jgi:pimeloyl-ACP methyl ester carboxylesterase